MKEVDLNMIAIPPYEKFLKSKIFGEKNYISLTEEIKHIIDFVNDNSNIILLTALNNIINKIYIERNTNYCIFSKKENIQTDDDSIYDAFKLLMFNPYIFSPKYLMNINDIENLFIYMSILDDDNNQFSKVYFKSFHNRYIDEDMDNRNEKKIKICELRANSILYYFYSYFKTLNSSTLLIFKEIIKIAINNIKRGEWVSPIKNNQFDTICIKIKKCLILYYSTIFHNFSVNTFLLKNILNYTIEIQNYDIGFYMNGDKINNMNNIIEILNTIKVVKVLKSKTV